MNAAKALSMIEGVQEINMDLEKKIIKIVYSNENISRNDIEKIVNEAIIGKKTSHGNIKIQS